MYRFGQGPPPAAASGRALRVLRTFSCASCSRKSSAQKTSPGLFAISPSDEPLARKKSWLWDNIQRYLVVQRSSVMDHSRPSGRSFDARQVIACTRRRQLGSRAMPANASYLMHKCETCSHTIYHVDRDGRPSGSWVLAKRGRIVCSVCGRFYGYVPSSARANRKRRRNSKEGELDEP